MGQSLRSKKNKLIKMCIACEMNEKGFCRSFGTWCSCVSEQCYEDNKESVDAKNKTKKK